MEGGDLLLEGDDSTWRMSDWQWDSRAFIAAPKQPKEKQQEAVSSCKKRKTGTVTGLCDLSARPCGGCKAAELEPLKFEFIQRADNSAGSSNCTKEHTGRPLVKMFETLQHSSPSSMAEAVMLVPGPEGSCQADACNSDMTEQSVWHQKSRICAKHMSGMFLKQGKPQQFCQQCGRSHNLDAFDKGRRSCRTQLAKHAARRRKRSASAINKQQTASEAQVKVASIPVPTGCKAAASIAALAGSSDAWLQTLCNHHPASDNPSHAQPLDPNFRHSSGSDQSLSNSTSFARNRERLRTEEHSTLALYDPPVVYATSTETFGRSPNEVTPGAEQPMCPSLWPPDPVTAAAGLASATQDDPLQDVLSWQLPPLEENCRPPMSDFDQALAFMQANSASASPHPAAAFALLQQQQQQQPARHLLARPITTPPPACSAALPNLHIDRPADSQVGVTPNSPQALPVYQSMPAAAQRQQQPYAASNAALRMSVKLFNCTPAQLPSTLHESVTGWLGSTPAEVEGYIRPGCVHLTVQATVPALSGVQPGAWGQAQPPPAQPQTTNGAVKQVVDHLLASPQHDIWHKCTMVVQLGSEVAVVHRGMRLKVWTIPAHAEFDTPSEQEQAGKAEKAACCLLAATQPSRLPVLSPAQPVCLVAGLNKMQAVNVNGGGLSGDCKVLCRAGGKHLEVQVSEPKPPSGELQVLFPVNLTTGLLYLEVQRGSFMGPALPVLVAPTAALAAEAVCMLQATLPADQQGLTIDLGCAMLRLSAPNKPSRQGGVAVATSDGADACAPVCTGETSGLLALLARAVNCGQVGLVKALMGLLPHKRSSELGTFRDASGMGLLHLAVRSGSLAVLSTLLENCNVTVWQVGGCQTE
ncbi:hypothetical protein ABBQ32_008285 [Trebouxia sp. C0010 RCD-2024]